MTSATSATSATGQTDERESVSVDPLSRTWLQTAAPVGRGGAPLLLAGRYEVRERLGRGSHGDVARALDRITGALVAVKLLRASALVDPARLRREVALMRRLRVPNVVRFLDEGVEGDQAFVVMDLAEGEPFPGRPMPVAWEDLAPATASLLATLARVHAEGILHRDLKPANVLVSAAGRVTLLDFGLSRLASMRGDGLTPPDGIPGTPAYLSPEQIRGERLSGRVDLYAAGVMIYEALSGRLPHDANNFAGLMRARLTRPPAPLGDLVPGLPPHVAAAVHALLAIEPEDRPASAEAALEAFGLTRLAGGSAVDRMFGAPGEGGAQTVDEQALRDLFVGRDRLFHDRQDAASALWRRTGGTRERVLAELAAWEHAGVIHRAGERWRVDREALATMDLGLDTAPADATFGLANRALDRGRQLFALGRVSLAAVVLEDGIRSLASVEEDVGLAWLRDDLFCAWIETALADWTPRSLDPVLYELSRCDLSTPSLRCVNAIARAAISITSDAPRARSLLEAVPPSERVELERRRWGLLVVAARSASDVEEDETLRHVEMWAKACGDRETLARLDGWRGRVLYRKGRFDEAAALHARSAAELSHPVDRVAARTNLASALVEAFRHEEALEVGRQVLAEAQKLRHPFLEARAEWAVRASSYRLGRTVGPDMELVDAVGELGVSHFEAHVCLTEAAAAFRAGDLAAGRSLALRAAEGWRSARILPDAADLALSLAIACGEDPAVLLPAEILGRTARTNEPALALQTAGLLSMSGLEVPSSLVRRLFEATPARFAHLRSDVLSANEALGGVVTRG